MIVDNYDKIYNFLVEQNINQYLNDDYYLALCVLGRNKDLPENEKNIYSDKELYYNTIIITDIHDILKYKDRVIKMCDALKCRAYLTTTPRNLNDYQKRFGYFAMSSGAPIKHNSAYKQMNNHPAEWITYRAAVMASSDEFHPTIQFYLIDLDNPELFKEFEDEIINAEIPYYMNYKTIHGYHYITGDYTSKLNHKDYVDDIEFKGAGCKFLLYANID